jgi:NADP-dependent 3-hydroxy acid dehydrogenase YdfG
METNVQNAVGTTVAILNDSGPTGPGEAPRNYTPQNIQGKAAVVTGGTTGIGFAVARLLAERGAKVLIFARNQKELDEALAELRQYGKVYGVQADQAHPQDVREVFQAADRELGGVDILVNNAAIAAGSVLESDLEDIEYGLNSNLLGYITCAREALQRMQARGDHEGIKGHIVNIGSLSAKTREAENDVYVATKAGIEAFSESLRKTVNPKGIKVSLIEPGLVATPMTDRSPGKATDEQERGEILNPEDIAEAVHYVLTQPQRCDVIEVRIRPHLQSI